MGWFIVLIGVLTMVKGATLIVAPRKLIHFEQKMLSGKAPKRVGWVVLLVGLLLCIAAPFSDLVLIVFLLGLLVMAKGAYVLLSPIDKIKKLKWFSLSDKVYRLAGVIVLILGMLLVSVARI